MSTRTRDAGNMILGRMCSYKAVFLHNGAKAISSACCHRIRYLLHKSGPDMEYLPEDLLVPISPLINAVDATVVPDALPDERRGLYDRFLDALVASLHDNVVDEESSDDEERTSSPPSSPRTGRSSSPRLGFYTKSFRGKKKQAFQAKEPSDIARALVAGQGFFSRARIESIGCKHGFLPSKDADGDNNIALFIRRKPHEAVDAFMRKPIFGILPSGWLYKQVHALPSVILVVTTVCASQQRQAAQDQKLYDTIENLTASLASKRKCTVHIVGLMYDGVTLTQAATWRDTIASILADKHDNFARDGTYITLLKISSDFQPDEPPSQALRQLHDSLRQTSLAYYLAQARRNRDKLSALCVTRHGRAYQHHDPVTVIPERLLPLAIRYAYKTAVFYECQWKHEKSLRWLTEAYRLCVRLSEFVRSGDKRSKVAMPANEVTEAGDGIEISISGGPARTFDTVPELPSDILHQCRGVAEWLNFKLVQAGLTSQTESGMRLASEQWRQNCRFFCTTMFPANPLLDWSYISRQWHVLAQMIERHPLVIPKSGDAAALSCFEYLTPWKCLESAVDAKLHFCYSIAARRVSGSAEELRKSEEPVNDFVGSIGTNGIDSSSARSLDVDHRGQALAMALKAVRIFKESFQKAQKGFFAEDAFTEQSASREGARLLYMTGGLLVSEKRYKEALPILESTLKYAKGWPDLELAVHQLLISCYDTSSLANEHAGGSEALASMIIDSYFNANMTSSDLRKALSHFASASGQGSLKWYREMTNEDDRNLPFSFQVTFPGKSFVTTGDSVDALIQINSNLDYAVHISSISLRSLAGVVEVPRSDLIRATNVLEGDEGKGIIVQRRASITISTSLRLPKRLEGIAVDVSGNGGELQGTAGKGSFAKSARPRSAGVTSAGGARFLSEDTQSSGISRGWNTRFLGGKPLRCDGVTIVFYPLQAERVAINADAINPIELTITQNKPKTHVNIRRTPFEEENYISATWARPLRAPTLTGPRSIRVLPPQANSSIRNITEEKTDDLCLEGTVNKVLLRLAAGQGERCVGVKASVSIFSVLVTREGRTVRLMREANIKEEMENCVDMEQPCYRTPCMVEESSSAASNPSLPTGWSLSGDGQSRTDISLREFSDGESVDLFIHFFRAANLQLDGERHDVVELGGSIDDCVCRTDFYVTVSYRQKRKKIPLKEMPRRGSTRRKPRMSIKRPGSEEVEPQPDLESPLSKDEADPEDESVSLEYNGSVTWTKPLLAEFSVLDKDCLVHSRKFLGGSAEQYPLLEDGDVVPLVCHLKPSKVSNSIDSFVSNIITESKKDSPIETNSMIHGTSSRVWNMDRVETKLSCAFLVNATLQDASSPRAIDDLGTFQVDWRTKDRESSEATSEAFSERVGPCALSSPAKVSFDGPVCAVERRGLIVRVRPSTLSPTVGEEFCIDATLSNTLSTSRNVTYEFVVEEDRQVLLLDGTLRSSLSIGAKESTVLRLNAISLTSGHLELPKLVVRSSGADAIDVNGDYPGRKSLLVLPRTADGKPRQ